MRTGDIFIFQIISRYQRADLGADLVIQSFHKTLPAMTQTAVLHNCSERVDSRLIRRFMGIYQSSSPSYILMASIDACMDKMVTDGKEMFREFTRILEKARRRLSECKYIRLVSPEIGQQEYLIMTGPS